MWSIKDIGKAFKQIKWLRDELYCLRQNLEQCCGNGDGNIDSSSILYVNTNLASETIGGFLAGEPITPPEGLTQEEFNDKLFASITFPTFTFNVNNETIEKGSKYIKTVDYIFNQNDGGVELSYSLQKNGIEVSTVDNFQVIVNPVLTIFTLQAILNYDASYNLSAGNLQTPLRTITPRFRIWYDALSFIPTNSAEVRAMGNSNSVWDNENQIVLNTGTTNTKFVVALPTSINNSASLSAQDITNNISLSYDFISTVNVVLPNGDTEEYRIYALEVDNPYPVNAEHQITI